MHSSSSEMGSNDRKSEETDLNTGPAPHFPTHESLSTSKYSHVELRPKHLADAVCPHCNGVGWLRINAPVGHPWFGKPYPCECRTQATEHKNLEELYRISNLDAFNSKLFNNFELDVSGVHEAYEAAYDFALQPQDWLILHGKYGTGKTHLAAAIANHVIKEHHSQVYFAIAPDLLDYLRSAYAPDSATTYDARFEQIRSVYLLIVDDLGAEQSTPWAVEKLYQIFNYRYNYRMPTVITTNCDMDKLDPRVQSRICDTNLCKHALITAGDYRMRKMDPRYLHWHREQDSSEWEGGRKPGRKSGYNGSNNH